MREKLNESKAAQIGLVAVLAVVAAVMLLGGKSGGGSEAATEAAPETGEAAAVATSTGMGELPTSVASAKAPPHAFRAAYDSGETVVLLVVHDGGIDDAYTALALKEVSMVERVAAFVVPAKHISRYASVTVGLGINQVPALIVLRPRGLSHGVPQASVLYGYQTPESVYQAIRDAVYQGPEAATYHPN